MIYYKCNGHVVSAVRAISRWQKSVDLVKTSCQRKRKKKGTARQSVPLHDANIVDAFCYAFWHLYPVGKLTCLVHVNVRKRSQNKQPSTWMCLSNGFHLGVCSNVCIHHLWVFHSLRWLLLRYAGFCYLSEGKTPQLLAVFAASKICVDLISYLSNPLCPVFGSKILT